MVLCLNAGEPIFAVLSRNSLTLPSTINIFSIISVNIAPLFKADLRPDQKLLVTRIAIPACGIIAVYVALKVQVVLELMFDANSFMLVSVAVPFVAGVWWKKANRTGALAAMAVGFLAWVLSEWLYPDLAGDVLGLLFAFLAILIVTPLSQTFDPPKPLIDADGKPIDLKGRLGILPLFSRSRPGGVRPVESDDPQAMR